MTERPTPERLAEIRAALDDTPMSERDSSDQAIAELFEEIDALTLQFQRARISLR